MSVLNLSQKLISTHLVAGQMRPGAEIALKIDQTLTQDATGTLVMLELEAMGLMRAKTEVSVQYVDHNLVQEDFKNADDHLFLRSACERFGIWYSRPGNGVSHPVHQERFGKPGRSLLGSDSHTPSAGSMAMLAIGAGGLEVALAIAGEPFHLKMPEIFGIRLTGQLPDWVSAKDVILEILRRHGVRGGFGKILEYYGPGVATLSAMDRHVIANMGAELGATTSVFPSDSELKRYLKAQERESDWLPLEADADAPYDHYDEINLSSLVPLVALPSSPDHVVPVREVSGRPIYQSYIGSSANPGFRDFAVVAEIVKGQQVHSRISLDINPSSRQVLETLIRDGHLLSLVRAGGRIHQAGCNGCIGMGQAPATHEISLRTVPRNFPGRSGTVEDMVYLVSPETAAASALRGKITDPRDLGQDYPRVADPDQPLINREMLLPPLPLAEARAHELVKGPNIKSLPDFELPGKDLRARVLLKVGDNISTDEILPAGARVLPFRSNIERISDFAFEQVDPSYPQRAKQNRGGHVIVAGKNYGQGSSREHAAAAPRHLGLKAVLAQSFARIHKQNLVNFGIVPLTFLRAADYDCFVLGDELVIPNFMTSLEKSREVVVENGTKTFVLNHDLSDREIAIIKSGSLINLIKSKLKNGEGSEVASPRQVPAN